MSVFDEAIAAIADKNKANAEAENLFNQAKDKWEEVKDAYGYDLQEPAGQLMALVKKYAPMVLKMTGVGTGGLAIGGLLENSDLLSGLLGKLTSLF